MVPKQRKAGQFGGDGHRSNRSAFRRSGGSVRPPSNRKLADHLGITLAKLDKLAAEDELYDNHGEEIAEWLEGNPHLWEMTDEGQPGGLEVHV